MEYLLAADGGNTKIDYALLAADGKLAGRLRTTSRSHEVLPGGYAEAARLMKQDIETLCGRCGVAHGDIKSAVLGLAGLDTPGQHQALAGACEILALPFALLVNDSFLSVKAACTGGVGICSINGTGTVVGGIDETGRRLQVGGVGLATNDYGGGSWLASEAVAAAYAARMQAGPDTALVQPVAALLGVARDEDWLGAVAEGLYGGGTPTVELVRALFHCANADDPVAISVLRRLAAGLAGSVLGCLRQLTFTPPVDIVLAGSVWAKAETPLLEAFFRQRLEQEAGVPLRFIRYTLPPVVGAACWAWELYHGAPPDDACRRRIAGAFATA